MLCTLYWCTLLSDLKKSIKALIWWMFFFLSFHCSESITVVTSCNFSESCLFNMSNVSVVWLGLFLNQNTVMSSILRLILLVRCAIHSFSHQSFNIIHMLLISLSALQQPVYTYVIWLNLRWFFNSIIWIFVWHCNAVHSILMFFNKICQSI